jgi:O-antigen ligase
MSIEGEILYDMRMNTERIFRNILFIVPITLPFSQARVDFFGIPLYLPEMMIAAATILYGVLLAYRKTIFFRVSPIFVSGIFLLIVGSFSSSFVSGVDDRGLGAVKSWILFPSVFGFLIARTFRSKEDVEKILLCWFLGIMGTASISLLPLPFVRETFDGRLASFYPSPNHLALFLESGVLIGAYLVLFSGIARRFVKATLHILQSGLFLVGISIFMTDSFGAEIVVFLGMAAFFMIILLPRRITVSFFAILFIFSFLFSVGIAPGYDRGALGSGEIRSSLASRVMIWNVADRLVCEHPFFGIGLRNFEKEYLGTQKDFPLFLEWAVPHPHNLLLSVRLGPGLSGLIGFLFLILEAAVRFWKTAFYGDFSEKRNISALFLSLILMIAVHGMVDVPFFRNDLSIAVLLIVGISATSFFVETGGRNRNPI